MKDPPLHDGFPAIVLHNPRYDRAELTSYIAAEGYRRTSTFILLMIALAAFLAIVGQPVIVSIFALAVALGLSIRPFYQARINAREVHSMLERPRTVTIDEQGVRDIGEDGSDYFTPWTGYLSARLNRRYLTLYVSKSQFNLFPLNSLSSDEYERLTAHISQKGLLKR